MISESAARARLMETWSGENRASYDIEVSSGGFVYHGNGGGVNGNVWR